MNKQNTINTIKNHLLILARDANENALRLKSVATNLFTSVTVISDTRPEGLDAQTVLYIADELLSGYEWLTSDALSDHPLTAWSRAMYRAIKMIQPGEFVWFVEDDVAFQSHSLEQLIQVSQEMGADFSTREIATKQQSAGWYWWDRVRHNHTQQVKSFNPICRCSYAHLMALQTYLERNGYLGFHEICLASIAADAGLKLYDWSKSPDAAACFGEFHFRPMIGEIQQGICHPVKDGILHEKICLLTEISPQKVEPSKYLTRLEGDADFGSWAIERMEFRWLSRWCQEQGIRKVLEFGPGASSYAFVGAGCDLHSYEADASWLRKHRLHLGILTSLSLLSADSLPTSSELPFIPDVVMVDGPAYRQGDAYSRRKECAWAMDLCGRFFLHDTKRLGERATLEDYQEKHFHVWHIPSVKGLALVTDLRRHAQPSQLPSQQEIVSRYEGLKKWGWYLDQYSKWQFWLATSQPIRALEIGAFDGVSANVMLDALFPHPCSRVDCIDPYEPDPTTPQVCAETKDIFLRNRIAGGHEHNIHLYEGRSLVVLSWMINDPEHAEAYDFIYIDGSHIAPFVLTDAVLAWNLLKLGGVMIFDDYGMENHADRFEPPRRGIDAFLQVYGPYVSVFEKGYRLGFIRCI
jgi:predicted O-methyltransferase YrrM